MSKIVELPIIKPLYATYHYQGTATAILATNPTIRNWYLNEAIMPECHTYFLTAPVQTCIRVENTSIGGNRYFDTVRIPTRYLNGGIHAVIRALIDDGYYVWFEGVDDYYVEGKSMYQTQHFSHDGLICGYDMDRSTYRLYAYDSNWVYRVFDTPQKAFEAGQNAMFEQGVYRPLCGMRPRSIRVRLNPQRIAEKLTNYLTTDTRETTIPEKNLLRGIAVQTAMEQYLDNVSSGFHPHDQLDLRVFRMIWEHKTVMQKRIEAVEDKLSLGCEISTRYASVVKASDDARMMYAAYHRKPRASLLPTMKETLRSLTDAEQEILPVFIDAVKKVAKQ